MVARIPGRAKASDLDDSEVLRAVGESVGKNTFPGDAFPNVPGKVTAAKLAKLHRRGLLSIYHEGKAARYVLTAKGKEEMVK